MQRGSRCGTPDIDPQSSLAPFLLHQFYPSARSYFGTYLARPITSLSSQPFSPSPQFDRSPSASLLDVCPTLIMMACVAPSDTLESPRRYKDEEDDDDFDSVSSSDTSEYQDVGGGAVAHQLKPERAHKRAGAALTTAQHPCLLCPSQFTRPR